MVTVQTWTTVRGIIWKQFQKVVADAAVRNVVTQRSSLETDIMKMPFCKANETNFVAKTQTELYKSESF